MTDQSMPWYDLHLLLKITHTESDTSGIQESCLCLFHYPPRTQAGNWFHQSFQYLGGASHQAAGSRRHSYLSARENGKNCIPRTWLSLTLRTYRLFKETPPHQNTASVLSKGESLLRATLGMSCFLGKKSDIPLSPFRESSAFSGLED